MCVIVVKPNEAKLSEQNIRQCWAANPDGAGIMWSEDGVLNVEKGFMHLIDFIDFWRSREWDNIPAVLHFRIATHGGVNKKNTHPFWVFPQKLAFVHNGIFDLDDPKGKVSDTQMFNRYYLKQLPQNFLNNMGITNFLESFIDPGSKLAFLNADGDQYIFNEDAGFWEEDGCWYSNSFWEYCAYSTNKVINNWEQWVEEKDETTSVPWDTYADGSTYEIPSDVKYEIWYCNECKESFSWEDAFEWMVHSGETIPECPVCNESKHCFGIGVNGLHLEGKFIPGTENTYDYWEDKDDATK